MGFKMQLAIMGLVCKYFWQASAVIGRLNPEIDMRVAAGICCLETVGSTAAGASRQMRQCVSKLPPSVIEDGISAAREALRNVVGTASTSSSPGRRASNLTLTAVHAVDERGASQGRAVDLCGAAHDSAVRFHSCHRRGDLLNNLQRTQYRQRRVMLTLKSEQAKGGWSRCSKC